MGISAGRENMELRILRYFLTIAQNESFSAAARLLNVTQPTLSRQIRELEEELGSQLLLRGKRRTQLTEAGKYLRGKAEEILNLAGRTAATLMDQNGEIAGDVYIAGGETRAMTLLARAMKKTRDSYPGIRFHVYSGNAEAVSERLDNGLADFGVFVRPANLERYEFINFPIKDLWGVLVRKDHPLAKRDFVTPKEFARLDLICSAQGMVANEIAGWLGESMERLNIVATYTLLYNASLMVEAGLGVALCIDGIADTSPSSAVCFRPFKPALGASIDLAWKRQQVFSHAAEKFLQVLKAPTHSAPAFASR